MLCSLEKTALLIKHAALQSQMQLPGTAGAASVLGLRK